MDTTERGCWWFYVCECVFCVLKSGERGTETKTTGWRHRMIVSEGDDDASSHISSLHSRQTRKAWMTTAKRMMSWSLPLPKKKQPHSQLQTHEERHWPLFVKQRKKTRRSFPSLFSYLLLFPQNKSSHCSLLSSELSFFILVRHLLLFFFLVLYFCNIFLSVLRECCFHLLLFSFFSLLSLHVICLPLDDDDSLVDLSVFVCPAHFFPSLSLPHPFRLRLTVRFGRRQRERDGELTTQDWPSKKRGCSSPFGKKRKTPSSGEKRTETTNEGGLTSLPRNAV